MADYPDIHLLSDDVDVVLWVLLVAHEKLGIDAMTAAEIAEVSTRVFRREITRQRASAILTSAKGLVARSRRASPSEFLILRAGIDRIQGKRATVIAVDPAGSFTALQTLDGILGSMKGEVLLCDPYVDDKTLLALTAVPKTTPIKLLTANISDAAQFRRKFSAYNNEYGNLEIRVRQKNDIHDRYLIDMEQMRILGQSLNGVGKKQGFIVSVGKDVRLATKEAFTDRWNQAVVFR